jgi:hypothetical protein
VTLVTFELLLIARIMKITVEESMRRWRLLVCWIVFLAPAVWASESVLYSITDESIVALATNRASRVGFPVAESRTDIFAIDPETGKKRLVFSDANAGFLLLAGKGVAYIVSGGTSIFALAAERQDYANDPHCARAVYELSTDGSGKAHKIFDLDNFANLFVNPFGSEIGYMPGDSSETHLAIRDTTTGKLLRDTEIFSRDIGADGASNFHWTPDGKRILFSLSGGFDSDEPFWTAPNSPIGTYVMNEDAGAPVRLAPEGALHPKLPGLEPDPDAAAILIGVLPDGEYLFSDNQYNPTGSTTVPVHLYSLDLGTKTQKIFPLQLEGDGGPAAFHLSPSGAKVVLTAYAGLVGGQLRYGPSTSDVWMLDLKSGKQGKLLSFTDTDTRGTQGPWMNLIGWLGEQ